MINPIVGFQAAALQFHDALTAFFLFFCEVAQLSLGGISIISLDRAEPAIFSVDNAPALVHKIFPILVVYPRSSVCSLYHQFESPKYWQHIERLQKLENVKNATVSQQSAVSSSSGPSFAYCVAPFFALLLLVIAWKFYASGLRIPREFFKVRAAFGSKMFKTAGDVNAVAHHQPCLIQTTVRSPASTITATPTTATNAPGLIKTNVACPYYNGICSWTMYKNETVSSTQPSVTPSQSNNQTSNSNQYEPKPKPKAQKKRSRLQRAGDRCRNKGAKADEWIQKKKDKYEPILKACFDAVKEECSRRKFVFKSWFEYQKTFGLSGFKVRAQVRACSLKHKYRRTKVKARRWIERKKSTIEPQLQSCCERAKNKIARGATKTRNWFHQLKEIFVPHLDSVTKKNFSDKDSGNQKKEQGVRARTKAKFSRGKAAVKAAYSKAKGKIGEDAAFAQTSTECLKTLSRRSHSPK